MTALRYGAPASRKTVIWRETVRAIGLVASVALIGLASAEQCPANFDEFIGAFESSAEFQMAHSKYPVTFRYMDTYVEGEPKAFQVEVGPENLAEYGPVQFPSPAQRALESIQQAVVSPNDRTRVVRLWIESSDFQIKYTFRQTSDCWELTRVDDGVF